MKFSEQQHEVIGIVMSPEKDPKGAISGLVLREKKGDRNLAISEEYAVSLAKAKKLVTRTDDCLDQVEVTAIFDGEGHYEFVRTEPGSQFDKPLRQLIIFSKEQVDWVE